MIILIVLSLAIGILFWANNRSFINPVTVFSFLWAFIFVLYKLNILGYYDLNLETTAIYYIQMIAFAIGGGLAIKVFATQKHRPSDGNATVLRRGLLCVLGIITVVFLFGVSIYVIRELLNGKTLYDITSEGDIINENNSTGITVGIKMFIIDPVIAMISPIVASEVTKRDAPYKKSLFLLNVVIVLLHTLQHGGRDMLIVFGISYVFAYFMTKRSDINLVISRRMKCAILILGAAVIGFSVWVSSSRGIDDLSDSLYFYFSGAVPHLQSCIKQISTDDMTWGLGALYGILYPIAVGLRGVGLIPNMPKVIEQITENQSIAENYKLIGSNISINAHVGASYYFYCDGGIPFVLIGCLAFGFAAGWVYKKVLSNPTTKNMAIYAFFMCVVGMSFIRFQIFTRKYALALLYIIVLMYQRKGVKNDNT